MLDDTMWTNCVLQLIGAVTSHLQAHFCMNKFSMFKLLLINARSTYRASDSLGKENQFITFQKSPKT